MSVSLDEMWSVFANYPLSILPVAIRALFTFFFPIAFVAYIPTAALLGKVGTLEVPPELAFGSPLVGLGLFLLARAIWYRSLHSYEGVAA